MTSIFIVVAEIGDVTNYSTHNICAYTDNAIADKVSTVLNIIVIARKKFIKEDLRSFIKKWHTSYPSPLSIKQEKFTEVYPELPSELAAIPKTERKGSEHEKYLKAVADYTAKLDLFKIALQKTESEAHKAYEEWEAAYNAAVDEFKSRFDMASLIPQELKEQINACLPYVEDADSFLVEKIDLLS